MESVVLQLSFSIIHSSERTNVLFLIFGHFLQLSINKKIFVKLEKEKVLSQRLIIYAIKNVR